MNPKNIQLIQTEIAIMWDDGSESYISIEKLRRHCPCAACMGEKDVMGGEHKVAPTPYRPESFQLIKFEAVGGYAINFSWADGHGSGIYSFPYLRKLGEH